MFMLTMLSAATFGTAQTSFVPGDGCLNVIDVSYAQGIGEYGDEGVSANYLHEKFINERLSIGPESDIIVMRSTSFLQFLFISVHIISFLTSGFLRMLICALEVLRCSTLKMSGPTRNIPSQRKSKDSASLFRHA
jgi:hypothetical protein